MAGEKVTLDTLHQLITKMNENMDKNMASVRSEPTDLNKKLSTVETNVDHRLAELIDTMEQKIAGVKDDIQAQVKSQVDTELADLKTQVVALQTKLDETESEMLRLSKLIDTPFPPNISVVIYGLTTMENETDEDAVTWLFSTVLEVDVKVDSILRTKPRDTNKIGVVKVRLASLEDKIEVLRAKRKCDDHPDAEDIIIKTCESHDARVNRLNSKLLLSKFDDGKEYTITGHGLIKRKADIQNGEGGVGSDDAEHTEVDKDETPTGSMGDKRESRASSASSTSGTPTNGGGRGRGRGVSQSAQGKPQQPKTAKPNDKKSQQNGRGAGSGGRGRGGGATTRRSGRNQVRS